MNPVRHHNNVSDGAKHNMSNGVKLLFISGDTSLAQGKKGPFYYLLEEFSKYWDQVDIICPRADRRGSKRGFTQKFFNNVFIHSSPWPLIFQLWFIFKKGAEIYNEQKFDIFGIHSYPPFYNDIGGLKLHKKIKVPYVLEVMHINGYPKASGFKERVYKILTRLFIKFFAKMALAIRVINQKQVPDFLINSGVNKNKIKYTPAFYIDFNIFKPLNLEKKYDIVFSGRLVKNKGINLLLEAIKLIKESQPTAGHPQGENVKLIIIGEGPMKKKIQEFIRKNNLQNNIELVGWLPSINDVARIYNQSKLMVMPSFNEGGPRVTLEAMACKTPVITTKVGIMSDIIEDPSTSSGQANGLFINWDVKDIKNKIMLLLNNDDLRNKIAENGYQLVQQFERKKIIENYARTYQTLLHHS